MFTIVMLLQYTTGFFYGSVHHSHQNFFVCTGDNLNYLKRLKLFHCVHVVDILLISKKDYGGLDVFGVPLGVLPPQTF